MLIQPRQQFGVRPSGRGRLFVLAAGCGLLALAMAGSNVERAHVAAAPIETSFRDTVIHPDQTPEREPVAGGGVPTLVYSNTGATIPLRPGAFRPIADDLFTTKTCGCNLDRFEFTIIGGGTGTGPGFTVSYALYNDCPSLGGQIIPGTAGEESFPDDGGEHTIIVAPVGDPVGIPWVVWLSVAFDSDTAGWLVGTPPEIGFSADLFDFPFFPCEATTGIPSQYAAFAARIFCDPAAPPAVDNPNPSDIATNVLTNAVLSWNGGAPRATSRATLEEQADFVNPANFRCGTEHPEVVFERFQAAVAAGEVPDPARMQLPDVAPRSSFGSHARGGGAPPVLPSDIFLFEDSNSLLLTNFSSSALFTLMAEATNAVLIEHGDNFDYVAFFMNFQPQHQLNSAAFHLGLENTVSGIGLNLFNNRPSFGVTGDNVGGWVMMWNQASWSTSLISFTQLVLGQEFEHRFAMFLSGISGGRRLQGGEVVNDPCGRGAHWNFRVDGQGSGMEIAEWVGSPPTRSGGTLSYNTDIGGVFSYPDLYLMGYVNGADMDAGASELRYMDDSTTCGSPYFGDISTWSSSDVITANGVRSPDAFLAQKHYNTAWVMFHLPGDAPLPTSTAITRVVTILNNWSESYETGTVGLGTMSNVLNPVDPPDACVTTYDVFLDTTNPPTTLICEGTSDTMCDPGLLQHETAYTWQVVATDAGGTTVGPIWSFTTVIDGPDCDGDGLPDVIEIAECTGDPACDDCNGNSIPDGCDITSGTSPDVNDDGIPDECGALFCGNGLIEEGEECDDNNGSNNDGCSSSCTVESGWECGSEPSVCTDIDECTLGTDDCDTNATCANTPGSFTCTCNSGYSGDGVTCTDNDECALGTDNCDANATCTNTVGSFTCACNSGYSGDGMTCTDDDECALGTDSCGANATCTNTPGSFACDCDSGYTGDGVTCTDIDECQSSPCDVNATCTNSVGSFTCECNSGFIGDGFTCTAPVAPPLPEDSLGVTDCTSDAECTNDAYCVPDEAGGFPGVCYTPKNRYLSVAPNPTNTDATARRLSVVMFERSCGGAGNTPCTSDTQCENDPDGTTCDDVRVGSQVIGWFGQPDVDGYAGIVDEASRHYTIWGNLAFPIECGVDELCPPSSHCDVGLGASNTCRWNVDDTEVDTAIIQLTGCHISPKQRDTRPGTDERRAANYYLVEAIVEGSDITAPSNYSAPLELRTVVVWGDMTGGTEGNVALPPDGSPGFLDILHQVLRFKDKGAATTPWLDLDPQEPDHTVAFLDMLKGVAGFKADPYPWDNPCVCAGLAPCD